MRYGLIKFLPLCLYAQFSQFFNAFYLVVGASQLVPQFVIGPLFTYLCPLAFVVILSIGTEAFDEYRRYKRDLGINNTQYERLELDPNQVVVSHKVRSADIRVGDILKLHSGDRVPCDCILLQSSNDDSTTFIRTDQLDGETDWKLRHALQITQKTDIAMWRYFTGSIEIEPPRKEIYAFEAKGTVVLTNGNTSIEHIGIESTLWSNVVVTHGPVIAVAIFTGENMRSSLHRGHAVKPTGIFYQEINQVSKILCVVLIVAALMLAAAKPPSPDSVTYFIRFVLLLTSIIPISLRVNLDIAKYIYKSFVQKDDELQGCVVRNSAIPEELGRIDLLLSDKTGTLTQNKMTLVTLIHNRETVNVTRNTVYFRYDRNTSIINGCQLIPAIAICHSVFPVRDEASNGVIYQASSPDEMAVLEWCSSHGLALVKRDLQSMTLDAGYLIDIEVLHVFSFDSTRKRMGVLVRDPATNEVVYFVKGADSVILPRLSEPAQWIAECIEVQARRGLRTLVYACKVIDEQSLENFNISYKQAVNELHARGNRVHAAVDQWLDCNLQLVGGTAVEDMLQPHVAPTIEQLSQAGIGVWMLTGDKTDTALSIATSTGLKRRMDAFFEFSAKTTPDAEAFILRIQQLSKIRNPNVIVCVDGHATQLLLQLRTLASNNMYYRSAITRFITICATKRSVLYTRCSPSEKSQIVELVKLGIPTLRVATVGDGGNDVPMIQASDCGIGIEGVEGRQASLAADVSIQTFSQLSPLLLFHGRLAQFRSHKLSSFIIHRGLLIGVIQVYFSGVFYFIPIAVFQGWLLVGFTTYYTMFACFSLIFDKDVEKKTIYMFPELYIRDIKDDLRLVNTLMFSKLLSLSIYQGSAIVIGTLGLFDNSLRHFVSVSFTSLVAVELLNVVSEVITWNTSIAISLLASVLIYIVSIAYLPDHFDLPFMSTSGFCWKVSGIIATAWLPYQLFRTLKRSIRPPRFHKLQRGAI